MTHREAVGGLWEEIGQLQLDFMVKQGLKPQHKLLDIGCGCLRGGVKFIDYLDNGHYFGIDKDADLLEAGHKEVSKLGQSKGYIIKHNGEFDFSHFGAECFDFAIAQSLFTHLNLNEILLCLINVEKALKRRGMLYATFFRCPLLQNCRDPVVYDLPIQWHTKDSLVVTTKPAFGRSLHYTFDMIDQVARWANLKAEYIGEWSHPRKQEMVAFYK